MRPPLVNQQGQQHYAFLQPLLGGEAKTTITFNKKTNELDVVHHVSSFGDGSFFHGDEEEECCQHDKEEIRQNRSSSAAAGTTASWTSSSCCFGCYHAAVTVSWILLSLLLTSQWTVFVYYPRVHGNNNNNNNNNHNIRTPEMSPYGGGPAISSTVTSTTMLAVFRTMDEKDLHVVAIAFCLYLLTLGMLGWVGIRLYHRHLYKQQQWQRLSCSATSNQWERNDPVKQQQRQQHHIYLRRSATAILVVLNIAFALLLIDQRGLALLAMIGCLVALVWSFAIVFCVDGPCREEKNNDKATIEHQHHQQSSTTAAPLVACLIV